MANANLGIAALADFAVPMLAPVSAALLVGTNFRTFGSAYGQVRRRRLGLPVLYTTIVVATVASGQFLASAAMSWMFKFWRGRLRADLAAERRRMLDESLPRPRLARLVAGEGPEVLVPVERLRPGDLILVEAGEAAPADGRVLDGEGIVDERCVRGLSGASRKRAGDDLLAGSTVLSGSLRIEVARPADRSLASAIGRALVAATSPTAGMMGPTLAAEAFADKAVGPTLATAGVGLILGGLGTAGAILRPDYATGPGVASPLETVRDVARCARRGIVVRSADVFERLAACDLIVLGDAPALRQGALEVVAVRTRLPESDLLRYAASAFRHLADERSAALVEACRDRRAHLLDLPALDLKGGVTVAHGDRRIRVRDHTPGDAAALVVEADGATIGVVEFGRGERPAAAAAVRRLRSIAEVPIALVSERPTDEVDALASALGVDAHQAGLSPGDLALLLGSFRGRGLRAAFIGDGPELGAEVRIALGEDIEASDADAVLMRPDVDRVADLWDVARSHAGQARGAAIHLAAQPALRDGGVPLRGHAADVGRGQQPRHPGPLRPGRRLAPRSRPGDEIAMTTDGPDAGGPAPDAGDDETLGKLKELPKEVGAMLISVGALGVVLPGMMGVPAVVAGGLVLWPEAFGKVEDWFQRRYPSLHRKGMRQVGRYLDDMARRFPT